MLNAKTTAFFKKALLWNFIGSSLYELIKVFHNFYLLSCMSNYAYGEVGFIFSSIYLAVRIADIGNAYSILPMLHDIQQSKKAFQSIIIRFFLFPQIPVLIAGIAILALRIHTEISWPLITIIFVLETYRLFLRYLLHAQFKNAHVVIIELCSFGIFLACVWLPYFIGGILTPQTLLYAHLIDSALATLSLVLLSLRQYYSIPTNAPSALVVTITRTMIANKFFTYLNRLSREFTSSNVLTPLYATLFGYEKVSIFYFLGIATMAYQMIIKNTITFSGNALLAQLRYASHKEKELAFHLITERLLVMIGIPLVIAGVLYHDALHYIDSFFLLLLVGFLVLMGIDLIIHIYEQYYLIQEAAHTFFIFKLVESIACLVIFYSAPSSTMTQAFFGFIIIKVCVSLCIALYAYTRWKIQVLWQTINAPLATTALACLIFKLLIKSWVLT